MPVVDAHLQLAVEDDRGPGYIPYLQVLVLGLGAIACCSAASVVELSEDPILVLGGRLVESLLFLLACAMFAEAVVGILVECSHQLKLIRIY